MQRSKKKKPHPICDSFSEIEELISAVTGRYPDSKQTQACICVNVAPCVCRRGQKVEHLQQAVEKGEQLCEGTHRFAEPVSNTTLNIWAGEPMLISPKY